MKYLPLATLGLALFSNGCAPKKGEPISSDALDLRARNRVNADETVLYWSDGEQLKRGICPHNLDRKELLKRSQCGGLSVESVPRARFQEELNKSSAIYDADIKRLSGEIEDITKKIAKLDEEVAKFDLALKAGPNPTIQTARDTAVATSTVMKVDVAANQKELKGRIGAKAAIDSDVQKILAKIDAKEIKDATVYNTLFEDSERRMLDLLAGVFLAAGKGIPVKDPEIIRVGHYDLFGRMIVTLKKAPVFKAEDENGIDRKRAIAYFQGGKMLPSQAQFNPEKVLCGLVETGTDKVLKTTPVAFNQYRKYKEGALSMKINSTNEDARIFCGRFILAKAGSREVLHADEAQENTPLYLRDIRNAFGTEYLASIALER